MPNPLLSGLLLEGTLPNGNNWLKIMYLEEQSHAPTSLCFMQMATIPFVSFPQIFIGSAHL